MAYRIGLGVCVSVSATLALSALPMTPVAADDVVEGPRVAWNHSVWGPQRAFTRGAETIKEEIERRTEGRWTLTMNYGGALSAPQDQLDNISIGAFEMGSFCAGFHPGKNPTVNALDLPFLPIADADVQIEVVQAFFEHPAVQQDLARWNARVIPNIQPANEVMGRGTPPAALEDWGGLRVRALGGTAQALQLLGAVPTTFPPTEIYENLERGVIDAASLPFTYAFSAYSVEEQTNWYTANMGVSVNTCPIAVNLDAWNALPEAYQQVFEDAVRLAQQELKTAFAAVDAPYLEELEARGLTRIAYDEATLEQLQELAGGPLWAEWVESASAAGLPAQELLDLILETAEQARN